MQVHNVVQLLRHFGPWWLLYRARYARQMRRGALRARLPAKSWSAAPLAGFLRTASQGDADRYFQHRRQSAPPFFFDAAKVIESRATLAPWDNGPTRPGQMAEKLARGTMCYFSRADLETGFPPDWHKNYATGTRLASRAHWSEIDDFSSGDIKLVWEPNRFAVAFALVRAYGREADDRFAELFWQLVESWRIDNPPQQGANWKCGQEVGLRVLAWCFGLQGFLHSAATTPQRVAELAQMIAVSGARIESNLRYALSQRNNHGISEAAALWTIGSLFPEFARAARWARLGRRLLQRQAQALIDDDGAFSQHSVNYHRVMLHDYLWSMRLGELHERPFAASLYQRVKTAGRFLQQLQDESTGCVPNYGHNDGALILPLNNCDYQDFRPVVQATQFLTTRTRCFPSGAWDEDLFWLFGREALDAPVETKPQTDLAAKRSGYYTLRRPAGFVLTRVPRFRHRPSQADALHVDLWWRGQNIARDAGTYSYNAPPPWDNVLGKTKYHNTVTVDDRDQMDRVGRFMWLPWLNGRVRVCASSQNDDLKYLEGRHDGYRRLDSPVEHGRGILRLGDEHWLIVDRLTGRTAHKYRLHWLLADLPYTPAETESGMGLVLTTDNGPYQVRMLSSISSATESLVRADANGPRGWQSRYYHDREPALSLALEACGPSVWFGTLFGPDACQMQLLENTLKIQSANWNAEARLEPLAAIRKPIVRSISCAGTIQAQLTLD